MVSEPDKPPLDLPSWFDKAAKALLGTSEMVPADRCLAVLILLHGFTNVQQGGWPFSISPARQRTLIELIANMPDAGVIDKANMALDLINMGPSVV